jgi:hypothetical protein
MMRRLLLPPLLLLASCDQQSAPDLNIRDGWARATAEGQTSGAIYLTIDNKGGADRLVGVSTDQAALAMLHENATVDGVSQMRMLDSVDVPANGQVALAPGGKHIMLEGLRGELVKGYRFEVELTFDRSGSKVVPVTVVGANER